jgi:hypothetical protein
MGVGFRMATSSLSGSSTAYQPVHAASQHYGVGGRPLASQRTPVASSPVVPSAVPYASSPAARFSINLVDPLLLAAPSRAENALFSGLASAATGATVIGTLVTGPVASGSALQAPAAAPPAIAFGLLSLPDHVQAPITPSQSSRARRPQAAPQARKPRAPRQTATQATAQATPGHSDVSSAAAFRPGSSSLSLGAPTGLHNPLIAGLAPATTGSVVIGRLVSGPVASGSGVVPPRVSVSSAEGPQKAAPKRKRVSQSKAAPVSQPVSCASGAPRDSAEKQPSKKRLRKSVDDDVPREFTQNSLVLALAEQGAAISSVPALVVTPSPAAISDSNSTNSATSDTSDTVLTTAAATGPIWHGAAPGVDLSGAPVLTGPNDPDSDVQPAAPQTKFPAQGATLKLCLLPWEAGAVLLWGEIPPQGQLRAVRRFRLRFPWASWATAEAWIATKCGKQKSEKQRQEEKKAAARAAKAARISDGDPLVAGRRTGPASNAGSVPTLVRLTLCVG